MLLFVSVKKISKSSLSIPITKITLIFELSFLDFTSLLTQPYVSGFLQRASDCVVYVLLLYMPAFGHIDFLYSVTVYVAQIKNKMWALFLKTIIIRDNNKLN